MKNEIENMLLILGAVLASVLIGCAREPAEVSTSAKPTHRLEFAWPVPVKFQVEEQVQRDGERIKFLHTLLLETNRNDELVLRWLDVEVKTVNKHPINTPESKKAAELASAVYRSLPPMRISRAGHFLGGGNISESFNHASEMADKASTNLSGGSHQDISQAVDDPAARSMCEQMISRCWNAWVEAWIGLEAGKRTVRPSAAQSRVGTDNNQFEPVIENFGAVPTNANFVFLRRRELAARTETVGSVSNTVSPIASKEARAEKVTRAETPEIRREMRAEVITDTKSLMPSVASYKVEDIQELPNARKASLLERHKYRFIWPESAEAHQ
ncbi:hypothetical protein [Pedosphaera parvula]|uniref:Lipoprotein n=1 Tax=Pedosphaera parvula (strain Ellin514) TaxID=320771 RepID=B9XM50_PEDPL|nr:hypothetical protein [Pedosphaera parvula]EEF59043.1 hypothetical protein Cflav_PD2170 [Pedosphaera parvula Ellin514]